MNSNLRNLALWAIIAVMLIALFNLFQGPPQQGTAKSIPYSQFLDEVEDERIKAVNISGQQITGIYSDNNGRFETYAPEDPGLVQKLEQHGIEIPGHTTVGRFRNCKLPDFLVANVHYPRRVDLFHAADAGFEPWRHGIWKIQGQASYRIPGSRDL